MGHKYLIDKIELNMRIFINDYNKRDNSNFDEDEINSLLDKIANHHEEITLFKTTYGAEHWIKFNKGYWNDLQRIQTTLNRKLNRINTRKLQRKSERTENPKSKKFQWWTTIIKTIATVIIAIGAITTIYSSDLVAKLIRILKSV